MDSWRTAEACIQGNHASKRLSMKRLRSVASTVDCLPDKQRIVVLISAAHPQPASTHARATLRELMMLVARAGHRQDASGHHHAGRTENGTHRTRAHTRHAQICLPWGRTPLPCPSTPAMGCSDHCQCQIDQQRPQSRGSQFDASPAESACVMGLPP